MARVVPAAPPESVPIATPPYVTSAADKPICPEPVPWLRTDTESSDKSPVTVKVLALKFPSASVKLTSLSRSCGELLTVFSWNRMDVEKSANTGASFSAMTVKVRPNPPDEISSPAASITFKRNSRLEVGVSELLE